MDCYFCNRLMHENKEEAWSLLRVFTCDYCPEENNMLSVQATTTDTVKYFHIYVVSDDYKITTFIMDGQPINIQAGHKYHLRLDLIEKTTTISCRRSTAYSYEWEVLLVLPTLSITPANVKKKLATYLTFM